MADNLTHEEFDRRVRDAMKPPVAQGGQGFAPGLQRIRQTAGQTRPMPARRQLPMAR